LAAWKVVDTFQMALVSYICDKRRRCHINQLLNSLSVS
jgi:hypothetical protein